MWYHLTPVRTALIKKKKKVTINAGEDGEKREPSYTGGESVNRCHYYGEQYGVSLTNYK